MSVINGNQFDVDPRKTEGLKLFFKIMIFMIYSAASIFATVIFQTEVNRIFDGMSPWLIFAATAGAWANCASVIVMFWAKEYWVSGTVMAVVSVTGWVIEWGILVLNTLVAFDSTWATGWAQLSPASPLFVILFWGVLALLHPDHKKHTQLLDFHQRVQSTWLEKLTLAMNAPEIQNIFNEGATKAAKTLAEKTYNVSIGDPARLDKRNNAPQKSFNAEELSEAIRSMAEGLEKGNDNHKNPQ